MGIGVADPDPLTVACTQLVETFSTNPTISDKILVAIGSGRITQNSTPAGIAHLLSGARGKHQLGAFLKAWKENAPGLSSEDASATLRSAFACYELARSKAHTVVPVWTGPEVSGSELRRTESVVQEIIANAERELLIVGYWLVAATDNIKSLLDLLISKAGDGVRVRFIFDSGEKSCGPDNLSTLNAHWPSTVQEPRREVYSWSDALLKATTLSGCQYDRKLHAKVIVADECDALVTSANLTQAGFLVNLEMGTRIRGPMAKALVRHFDLLIDEGVLESVG